MASSSGSAVDAQLAKHLARNLVALRQARKLTQDAVAKAAGVPRSTIAHLESGAGNPSLAVLARVAQALGSPIDELLAAPRAAVRHWQADEIVPRHKGHGVQLRALVPEPMPDELVEVMAFEPGGAMGGTPHLPGTREYFSCLEGRVMLTVAGETYRLATGDVLAFPGQLPHSYKNLADDRPARGVSVVVLTKARSFLA